MQRVSPQQVAARPITQWLRPLVSITLLLLAAQFLVGMLVNLYVKVPASHPGADAPEYFSGVARGVAWALVYSEWALKVHAIIGFLAFLAALAILALAFRQRERAWIIAAAFGLLGILAAGFNGASFLNYGHDFSSLLMSLGFLVAVVAYALGMYHTR